MGQKVLKDRRPWYSRELLDFDVDAPIDLYKVDAELRRLVSAGLLPKLSGSDDEKVRTGRSALYRAIVTAHDAATAIYHDGLYYNTRARQYAADTRLLALLEDFVARADAEQEKIPAMLSKEQVSRFRRPPAARPARDLIGHLKALTSSGKPKKPKGSATDVLAQLFIWALRDLWQAWTGKPALKSGDPELISLASAICRDTRVFDDRDEDGSLEEWLLSRFKANWNPLKRPNLP